MRPLAVVEAQIPADRGAGLSDAGVGSEVDLLVFDRPPEPSTKTLSRQAPLPSMLIAILAVFSTLVKSVEVNWLP